MFSAGIGEHVNASSLLILFVCLVLRCYLSKNSSLLVFNLPVIIYKYKSIVFFKNADNTQESNERHQVGKEITLLMRNVEAKMLQEY